METGIDYVRLLCKERNVSISKLERDLGFSNGYLNPKKLKKVPYDRAVMIADYLNGDINRILDSNVEAGYYINPETAATLFQLYVNTTR